MNVKYVFEVMEIQQKDDLWEISGLVFSAIKLGDILSTTEQLDDDMPRLLIKDIITYGHHMEKLDEGYTGRIVVQNVSEADFTQGKYLYRVSSNG